MSIYLDDVAFWVEEHKLTGDGIPASVARKIAEYWTVSGDDTELAAFARGEYVNGGSLRDEIAGTICYARTAGMFDTIHELYALKDWVLNKAMGI